MLDSKSWLRSTEHHRDANGRHEREQDRGSKTEGDEKEGREGGGKEGVTEELPLLNRENIKKI